MCSPTMMAVGMGGSSLLQGFGQRSAAKQMNKARKQIAERGQRNAIQAAAQEAMTIALRERQEDVAASQRSRQTLRDSYLAEGQFRSGAGSRGITGASVQDVQMDFDIQEALSLQSIETQREFQQQSLEVAKASLEARTQSRINQLVPQLEPEPSMMSILLGAGVQAASGYQMGVGYDSSGGAFNTFTGDPIA